MTPITTFCLVCGRQTPIDELLPVKLVRDGEQPILSAICGACFLDVEAHDRLNKDRLIQEFVQVRAGRKVWAVVRR